MAKMGKLFKQAKKMQDEMGRMNEEIKNSLIEVETAGGAIAITISGDQLLQSIKIDPEVVDKEDIEGLEDLILTSVNQAIQEAKKYADEQTQSLSNQLNLPPGLGF